MTVRNRNRTALRVEGLESRLALNASWHATYQPAHDNVDVGVRHAMVNQLDNHVLDGKGNVNAFWVVANNYLKKHGTTPGA